MVIVYDPDQKSYKDSETGRYLSEKRVRSIAARERAFSKEIMTGLAAELEDGVISTNTWYAEFLQTTKESTIRQYMMARGGRSQMKAADWGIVGRALRDQYGYANDFLNAIPDLSEAQIRARSHLYMASTTYSFHRGLFRRFGIPVSGLPMPAQNTTCRANCRCWWDIVRLEGEGNYLLRWRREQGDSCDVCVARAIAYESVEVRDGKVLRIAELQRDFEKAQSRIHLQYCAS